MLGNHKYQLPKTDLTTANFSGYFLLFHADTFTPYIRLDCAVYRDKHYNNFWTK